jgi:hypothetical protein
VTGVLQAVGPEAALLVVSASAITAITAAVGALTRLVSLRLVLGAYERCRSDTSDAGRDISIIARSLHGRRGLSHDDGTSR